MSTWHAHVGSEAMAARLASQRPGLLRDHRGESLPGEICDAGGGWVTFDDVTWLSLRIHVIEDAGDAQLLTGPGGERWPLEEHKEP